MADETPDTTEEQVTPVVADPTRTEETTAAPQAEAAEQAPAEPVTPLTPKERKVAARARRGLRRGATPEERTEARKAKAAARTRYRAKRREKDRAAKAGAGPAQTPPTKDHGPGAPKERLGIVVSDKADKTITVRIDVARRHRRYQKIVRSSTTLHAHDETNDANAGDRVRLVESRPLSATKRWRLVEILERAK
jgi:small subunit ribosomal protein S17